jgi:hypothetical protein
LEFATHHGSPQKQAALTGYDNVGNATAILCSYQVNCSISGLVAPVNNPPTVNVGKSGKVYPVKWQLRDATGAFIGALDAVVKIVVQSTSCSAFTNDPTDALESSTIGNTGLRFDRASNVYIYNWATPGKGCYTLLVTLNSGQILTAFFKLS